MIKEFNAPMWDQMQFFCKKISDHQIRLVLIFNDFLNENILVDAVKISIQNNPITFAQYLEKNRKPVWSFTDYNIDELFSFQESKTPSALIESKLVEQTNTISGPQIKISLIRSKSDCLIINCDHTITDAAGVKYFTYELAQNYTLLSQGKPAIKKNYTPSRSLKLLSGKVGVLEKFSILKLTLKNKKTAPTFHRNNLSSKQLTPGYNIYTIPPKTFEKIKLFGKKSSATINDILLCSIYFTLKRISDNSNKTNRLSYSSDLRKYMKNESYDTLSNFSVIHNIDIDNSITDFNTLLKEITNLTKARKQKSYNLADFPMLATLFKLTPYKKVKKLILNEFNKITEGKYDAVPGLTNTGIIEEEKSRFNSNTPDYAYILGTINHPCVLQVAISGYRNQLTISIGSYFEKIKNNDSTNFMEELNNTLNTEILNQLSK